MWLTWRNSWTVSGPLNSLWNRPEKRVIWACLTKKKKKRLFEYPPVGFHRMQIDLLQPDILYISVNIICSFASINRAFSWVFDSPLNFFCSSKCNYLQKQEENVLFSVCLVFSKSVSKVWSSFYGNSQTIPILRYQPHISWLGKSM